MKPWMLIWGTAGTTAALLIGCGDDDGGSNILDASGPMDGVVEDTSVLDGHTEDSTTLDGAPPDGTAADAGPVDCSPHEWSCNPAGTSARYCNAAGDGFVRDVGCGGRMCTNGLCEPRRGINSFCGALKNGANGELVGGVPCPAMVPDALEQGWSYMLWLDRGDQVTVQAEALSPLVEAHVRIQHGCPDGEPTWCETTDGSTAGGEVEIVRTAPRREAIQITLQLVRASGDPTDVDGARLRYDISVAPADPKPALPTPLCTPNSRTCTEMYRLTYCESDGQYVREHVCTFEPSIEDNPCVSGRCTTPRGDACDDAALITRPASDEVMLDATLVGVNDDVDPGTSCLDVGMSGVDRIFRIDMTEGERFRATLNYTRLISTGETYAMYVVEDCLAPETSCVAGSLGYRTVESGAFGRVRPALSYVTPRDQSIYLVVDTEFGDPDILNESFRVLTITWDGTCSDGNRNGDETGVDCGGPCGPCPDGQACNLDAECESRRCEGRPSTCTRPAGCGDGVLSLGEECDDGNSTDDDGCSNSCLVAACDDGVQNGDETGTDEGGSCAAPLRDRCRRAEVLPLSIDASIDPDTYVDDLREGNLAAASNANTPSCGIDGPDHAFYVPVQEPSEMNFVALATNGGGTDTSRSISVSVRRGCDGAEVACVSGTAGEAPLNSLALDPGEYVVWIDGLPAGQAGTYEMIFGGRRQP